MERSGEGPWEDERIGRSRWIQRRPAWHWVVEEVAKARRKVATGLTQGTPCYTEH